MSVIAAFVGKSEIWIASDSGGEYDGTIVEVGSKLIPKGNYVVGFCGSFRIGDLIRESEDLPNIISSRKDVCVFRDTLIDLLENEPTTMEETELLLITSKGIIWEIGQDFQIQKYKNYAAIGGGETFALGSLFSHCETYGKENEDLAVKNAVKAAIKFSVYCTGKVHIQGIALD